MHLPQHIAIIMDGNGRWAKLNNRPVSYGHKVGSDTIQNLVEESDKLGLKYITVYAFSTENWKRPKAEVTYLMGLLQQFLNDTSGRIEKSNIKITFIGSKDKLGKQMIKSMERIEKITKEKTGLNFIIALNYGAREELLNSYKRIGQLIKEGKLEPGDIDSTLIESYLYTSNVPDPDLIIRTGGDLRLSNFLLYQASYAELYFTKVLWPDFTINHLKEAIKEYNKRKRRFGGRDNES